MSYEIIKEKDIPEIDVLVAGFPAMGLIGGIASEQLINSLELEQVASVKCDEFSPTAVIFDGIPRRPVRFFAGKGFLLVKSDMVIPPELSDGLAEAVIDWAADQGVREVIIFDAIPEREGAEGDKKVWGVLSTYAATEQAKELDIDLIKRGAITGISSSMLLYAAEKELIAVGMLAEGSASLPDPRAAAILLEKFAEYRELDIDTSSLLESAEDIEKQYTKLVSQANKAQDDMDTRSAAPPIYG